MMGDATGNDASLVQTMLQGMLQETSTHLRTATRMIGEQLEMIRQLQHEIQAVKTQAAEELEKPDELRRLHDKSTRHLRVMREQVARVMEQLPKEVMKELTKVQAQTAEEIKQVKEQLLITRAH
ncbi:hypothetical protein ACKRZS_008217 [Fusarium odoratissimum]